jgi:hypothetical protein
MSRYLHMNGGKPKDHLERDKLLYWYVHSFLWGRYAGSTESVINQDLAAIEESEGALDRLTEQLRQIRGTSSFTRTTLPAGAAARASTRCSTY